MPVSEHAQKLIEGVKIWNTWRFAHPHERPHLINARLAGRDLRGANLIDGELAGADLTDANLRRANLKGADLTGANLTRANLQGANLTNACLRGACLDEATFQKAVLTGADLDGASVESAGFQLSVLHRARVPNSLLDQIHQLVGADGVDAVRIGADAALPPLETLEGEEIASDDGTVDASAESG